jgi:hypothetical protein
VTHFASPSFWEAYAKLPENVRALADKNYALLKENPRHPSLQLKKLGRSGRSVSAAAIALWPLRSMQVCFGSGSVLTRAMMLSSDRVGEGAQHPIKGCDVCDVATAVVHLEPRTIDR